jgi:LPXTG cell wall anchor motif
MTTTGEEAYPALVIAAALAFAGVLFWASWKS